MKKYFVLFLLLIVPLGFMQYKQNLERDIVYYPDWYRLSRVLLEAQQRGVAKTSFIVGNSYTYTSLNPEVLNNGEHYFLSFTRGGTHPLETLMWLERNRIFPKEILVPLEGEFVEKQYFAKFNVIKADDPGRGFDLFKARVETELKFLVEKYLSFTSYHFVASDAIAKFRETRSVLAALKKVFLPEFSNVKALREKKTIIHANGFLEDVRQYTPEEVKKRVDEKMGPSYGEHIATKQDLQQSEADLMRFFANVFTNHGTRMVFFRLPKLKVAIESENRFLPMVFQTAKDLAASNKNIRYVDLTSEVLLEEFKPYLSDGGHWMSEGATRISRILAERLRSN